MSRTLKDMPVWVRVNKFIRDVEKTKEMTGYKPVYSQEIIPLQHLGDDISLINSSQEKYNDIIGSSLFLSFSNVNFDYRKDNGTLFFEDSENKGKGSFHSDYPVVEMSKFIRKAINSTLSKLNEKDMIKRELSDRIAQIFLNNHNIVFQNNEVQIAFSPEHENKFIRKNDKYPAYGSSFYVVFKRNLIFKFYLESNIVSDDLLSLISSDEDWKLSIGDLVTRPMCEFSTLKKSQVSESSIKLNSRDFATERNKSLIYSDYDLILDFYSKNYPCHCFCCSNDDSVNRKKQGLECFRNEKELREYLDQIKNSYNSGEDVEEFCII